MTRAAATTAALARADHLAPLDGLRGIAILLVLWFHAWQQTWLGADVHLFGATYNFNVLPEVGFAGVDLFFFISGFVLFYPYARTLFDGRPLQSVATFAYRRVLKIVPSYYLALFFAIALGFRHFDSNDDAVKQIVTHVFFVHNLFDDTWGGIDSVAWSLAVEVQFYVLFPAICWCAMRRPIATFATLIGFGLVYRWIALALPGADHNLDRLPGTIDLFAAGMLAAWLYRFVATKKPELAERRMLWTAVAIAGFLIAYEAMCISFEHRGEASWSTTWKVVARAMMMPAFVPATLGSLFAFRWWQRALANPVLTFLSLISYNLYLWHQEIAVAIREKNIFAYTTKDPHGDPQWQLWNTLGTFAVSIFVAWVLTTLFEQPILRRRPFENALTGAHPPARELATPALP